MHFTNPHEFILTQDLEYQVNLIINQLHFMFFN